MTPSDPSYTLWLEMRLQEASKRRAASIEDLIICCLLWLVWGFFLGMLAAQ